jgi:rSAM/selenodomain-associated transferase 2
MLSIVVPTLNEADALTAILAYAREAAGEEPVEFIVADCDSPDGTAAVAASLPGVRVVGGGLHRADAMNRGSALASGDTLLFMHADTLLPDAFPGRIRRALQDDRVVGGAFDFQFGRNECTNWRENRCLDLVVLCNRVRFRWTSNFYGDQAIFCRRDVFRAVGGFPHVPIMEDIRFCQRMKRLGKTAIIQPGAITSPRRFLTLGVLRQFANDLFLLGCESCGASWDALHVSYNGWNRQRPDVAGFGRPAGGNPDPDPAASTSPAAA